MYCRVRIPFTSVATMNPSKVKSCARSLPKMAQQPPRCVWYLQESPAVAVLKERGCIYDTETMLAAMRLVGTEDDLINQFSVDISSDSGSC